ncbi:MAG: regulator [Candidatus Nanoclepta minutus]|uniref:Regulator n=1 Tax=Candidatus Nanoclepta minutus TaxID=1940235 RepID=A0A397WM51_9ARCH|nr:MAG: regulator [Candidatus Nanoclepta minutus]
MEVPLKPMGKEDIRKLESALLVMALFDKETFEAIRNPAERLTWVDSLYTAAAALAREKAGMPLSKISEEIGVSEASIRKHLKGETKAGKLVLQMYEKLSKEGFKVELPEAVKESIEGFKKEIKQKIEEIERKIEEIKKIIE